LNEGPQYRIGSIQFLGGSEKERASLLQKLGIKPGSIYSGEVFEKLVTEVHLANVAEPTVRYSDAENDRRTVDIKVDLRPKR
jgi:outer membrane protein assembly factor BamA